MQILQKEDDFLCHLSDGHLVQHTFSGNERAFEVLVGRYYPSLFQYITSCLGDYDLSCDVLQQVLVQLYLSLPSLHQEYSLKSWLWQVTRHKVIDATRRKQCISLSVLEHIEEENALLLIPDPALLPEEQLEHRELQHLVKEAIAILPQRYQQVVTLRYMTQLSFSAIGRLIGIPEATAKTHFQRARPLLRAALQTKLLAEA